MNYLVIDLEMCKVPKHYWSKKYKYANEIVQVGAVLLDEEYEVIGKINQYVHPEYGVIDHFISNLTGIQNSQVKHAPCLKEVLKHMVDWLGEREYKVSAWSDNDYCQLQHEIICKEIVDSKIDSFMDSERWMDYQAEFGRRFDFLRAVSLEEALMYCNIDLDGRLHDGLDDAVNTATLIKTLELNKDFVLCQCDIDYKTDSDPLCFSIGNLFAGLNLSCIA